MTSYKCPLSATQKYIVELMRLDEYTTLSIVEHDYNHCRVSTLAKGHDCFGVRRLVIEGLIGRGIVINFRDHLWRLNPEHEYFKDPTSKIPFRVYHPRKTATQKKLEAAGLIKIERRKYKRSAK